MSDRASTPNPRVVTFKRLKEIEAGDAMSRTESAYVCKIVRQKMEMDDHARREDRRRAALAREPSICSMCGIEIVDGDATFAGVAHWSCRWPS